MEHSVKINYNIKYVWIGLIFIILSCFALFYGLYQNSVEFGVIEVIAYVTGMTATLTLIYHAFSLEHQIKTQNSNNSLYRAKYTYDLISEWTKPSMMRSIAVSRALLKDKDRLKELKDQSTVEKFDEYLSKNIKKRAHLILILNYFENICTMIETNHIDQEIVKKAFKSLFVSHYKTLKHFIDLRQKEYPTSWCYFEKVSKEWEINDKMA